MRQLVGIDDRADGLDLTAADLEHQHAEQPLMPVEQQRSRAAVDLDGSQRRGRDCGQRA